MRIIRPAPAETNNPERGAESQVDSYSKNLGLYRPPPTCRITSCESPRTSSRRMPRLMTAWWDTYSSGGKETGQEE